MKILPDWLKNGYLRVIEPIAEWLIRHEVHPNVITTVGTLCTVTGGIVYATGHIRTGGWFLSATALFDVLDGTVARRTNRTSTFGAFYDSTLDRVADGALMGGLAVFYATSIPYHSTLMMIVCILGLIGAYMVSYTRARAEALGINAKVGLMQRPERVVLLSAPQALFGLALHGLVLGAIIVFLAITAWSTAVQRMIAVYKATTRPDPASPSGSNGAGAQHRPARPELAAAPTASAIKGE